MPPRNQNTTSEKKTNRRQRRATVRAKQDPRRKKPAEPTTGRRYVPVGNSTSSPYEIVYGCIDDKNNVSYGYRAPRLRSGVKPVKHGEIKYNAMFQNLGRSEITAKILAKAERADQRRLSSGEQ
ncbi:hypothetical protein CGCFRS4_v016009 [Colletotrichum fructicola]|nr:hypothetical protein CGCFRS4_v016009 [Colletotrichum fructicola]